MKRISIFLTAVVLFSSFAMAEGPKPATPAKKYIPVSDFDPKRDASKDVAEAIAEAGRTGKNVLIDVGGKWCVWCTYFDNFFKEHALVREFRDQNYIVVRVNYSPENKNEAFLSKYPGISGYPHIIILDGHGKVLTSQDTSKLEEGRGYSLAAVAKLLQDYAPSSKPSGLQ